MPKKNVTRGYGLLENFLSRKRAHKANKLISNDLRAGRILDIGCGTTPFFLISTKFKEKYGLDPLVNLPGSEVNITIEKFNTEYKNKLPFNNDFFDVVTMLAVFEHIDQNKLINIIKEIRRVLKPKGRFIITTPASTANKLLKVMSMIGLISSEEFEEHKGVYNHISITRYLIKAGFDGKKINFGSFELFLNNWVYADK
jgi:ubiquinone/menaquinone biosynthesis C-methylase UbiE